MYKCLTVVALVLLVLSGAMGLRVAAAKTVTSTSTIEVLSIAGGPPPAPVVLGIAGGPPPAPVVLGIAGGPPPAPVVLGIAGGPPPLLPSFRK